MKKVLAVILALAMLLSVCCLNAFAEEAAEEAPEFNPYASPDESTVRVAAYEEQSERVGLWLHKFDLVEGEATETDPCIGKATAVFRAAAPVKAISFKNVWAGKSENDQDADMKVELFKFDTDIATSVAGTPVYSETRHYDGDKGLENEPELCHFQLSEPVPADKYVLRISQLGTRGSDLKTGRYVVLPSIEAKYPPSQLEFEGNSFGFMVDFVKTEGVTEYFDLLSGEKEDYTIDKEQTVTVRDGDAAYNFRDHAGGVYAVLTPVIPEGKALYSINFVASPTWNNTDGDSNADIYVYKWKGDYDTTVESRILFEGRVEDHQDNSDLVITFDGKTLRYGDGADNRYLIVIEAYEGAIGCWPCTTVPDDWAFFANEGDELDQAPALKCTYASVGDLGPEPTEAPTEVPTEAPTAAPTDEPAITEAPAATEAPKATEKAADKAKTDDSSSNSLPIIIVAICAAIVIACVVVIIVKKKKG